MRRTVSRPLMIALAAAAALATAVLAVPAQAGAATLYVCVKKRTGAARFVGGRASCRRGETKLSLNTRGLPGRNGTNGKNGAAGKPGTNGKNGTNGKDGKHGANGASAGLVAFKDSPFELPLTRQPLVTLPGLPAGNYIAIAKVQLEDNNPTEGVNVHCYMGGDEATVELAAKGGSGSLSLTGIAISPLVSSLTLECDDFGTSGVEASFARIAAIQVQSLGGSTG